jgi:hypothetical protein
VNVLGVLLIVVFVVAAIGTAALLYRAAFEADRRRLRVLEERWRAEQRLQALTRLALSEMRAEVRRHQRARR